MLILLSNLHRTLKLFGFDIRKFIWSTCRIPWYFRDLYLFYRANSASELSTRLKLRPCLDDVSSDAGVMSGHYFHQDLYVAQRIFDKSPLRHIDIGSRIDGFVAHVASFRPIEVGDIRSTPSSVKNISFTKIDLLGSLDPSLMEKFDSVSCLHVIEHLGLGRYGDKIRSDAQQCGIRNLANLLSAGGTVYLSVPIGLPRTEFNAHRVFGYSEITRLVEPHFAIHKVSYVCDRGDFVPGVNVDQFRDQETFDCDYGCIILEMGKL